MDPVGNVGGAPLLGILGKDRDIARVVKKPCKLVSMSKWAWLGKMKRIRLKGTFSETRIVYVGSSLGPTGH